MNAPTRNSERFIGSWSLVAWTSTAPDGTTHHPFGEDAIGFLFYTGDGHMAAHLMRAQRASFASENLMAATADERAAAFIEHFSYCGRYTILESEQTVTHHVLASSAPNWVGKDQVRQFLFSGNTLTLSATNPDGSVHTLVWRHH